MPPNFDLDTIYYFEVNKNGELDIGENSRIKPRNNWSLLECLDVYEKDFTESKEKGFTFIVNI